MHKINEQLGTKTDKLDPVAAKLFINLSLPETLGEDSSGLDRFRALLRTRVGAGEEVSFFDSSGFGEIGRSCC